MTFSHLRPAPALVALALALALPTLAGCGKSSEPGVASPTAARISATNDTTVTMSRVCRLHRRRTRVGADGAVGATVLTVAL